MYMRNPISSPIPKYLKLKRPFQFFENQKPKLRFLQPTMDSHKLPEVSAEPTVPLAAPIEDKSQPTSTIAAYIQRFRTQPPTRSQERVHPQQKPSFWWKQPSDRLQTSAFSAKENGPALFSHDEFPGRTGESHSYSLSPALDALMAELDLDQTKSLNQRADAILAKYGCQRSSSTEEDFQDKDIKDISPFGEFDDHVANALDDESTQLQPYHVGLSHPNDDDASLSSSSSLEGLALIEDATVQSKGVYGDHILHHEETQVDMSLISKSAEAEGVQQQDLSEAPGDGGEKGVEGNIVDHADNQGGSVKDKADLILEYLRAQVDQLEEEYAVLQTREKAILEALHQRQESLPA